MRAKCISRIFIGLALLLSCTPSADASDCSEETMRDAPFKWVDLLSREMLDWSESAERAARKICPGRALSEEYDRDCMQKNIPQEQRTRTWVHALHAAPSAQSTLLGSLTITGRTGDGFSAEYVAPNGAINAFKADNRIDYTDTWAFYHTVLEERGSWVLLPKDPFPVQVWIDTAPQQLPVTSVGKEVYALGGQSVVLFEFTASGMKARKKKPSDVLCGDAVFVPPAPAETFIIPWTDLYDKNCHLRLRMIRSSC
jgi:hypothetical protein